MEKIDDLEQKIEMLYRMINVMSRNLTEVTNLTLLLSQKYMELQSKIEKQDGGLTWN